jgi:hypothetical protein
MDVRDMLSTRTERGSGAVIADWYLGLAGNRSSRRNHWTTKVMYYRAVTELLDARPGRAGAGAPSTRWPARRPGAAWSTT